MIYDNDNTVRIGRRVKRVVDANGIEYDVRWLIRVDTTTGEVVRIKTKDGTPVLVSNGMLEADMEMARETVYAAPPVVVEFVHDPD